MKRLACSILLIVIVLFPVKGRAQFQNTFRNSFFSLDLGASLYLHNDGMSFGAGGNIAYGKWIISTVALRGGYNAEYLFQGSHGGLHHYVHVDFMFDLVSSLKGRNTSDWFRSFFILGIGATHVAGDNDFATYLGFGADFKVSDDWRINAELASFVQPADFDDNHAVSFLPVVKFGLTRDIEYNPTRSRSRLETRGFADDWFFQLALGAQSFNYKGLPSFGERLSLVTPVMEFSLGKRLNSTWLIRAAASGLYAKSEVEPFSYFNFRGDLMLDPAGWLFSNNRTPFFDVRPYLGADIIARFDDLSHFFFGGAAGLVFNFRIDARNDIFLDARYLYVLPRFAKVDTPQSTLSVGFASLMLGYSHVFSHNSFM